MAIELADSDKRLVILVIEDEPMTRIVVSDFIAAAGFEALQAANADKAIAILESRNDIRAVFTDINMPGSMDGLMLARAVRDRWPPIHIIITSAIPRMAEGDMPDGCLFFQKPYNPRHIVGVLSSLAA